MKNMYLVFVGEYSDRHCVGFCSTEEEAQRFCAVKNSTRQYYSDDYEYEEAECLDGRMDGFVDLGQSVKVQFEKNKDGWTVCWVGDVVYSVRHKPRVLNPDYNDYIKVDVWMKEYDKDKAIKIAQDTLYEYLALREEACKEFQRKLKEYLLE